MRRFLSTALLLTVVSVLFACGGGGGGGGDAAAPATPTAPVDSTPPTVTAFSMPAAASGRTVPVIDFAATDSVGVVGYLITSTATPPAAADAGWTSAVPSSFTFPAAGAGTAYAWARDAAGNISVSRSATVTVTDIIAKSVQGTVTNPTNGTPVSGASVTAVLQGTATPLMVRTEAAIASASTGTATTDANGNFSIDGLVAGSLYSFEITKPGFEKLTYFNVSPDANNALVLERGQMLPSSIANQTAAASGTVRNASTNAGLAGMTVALRPGIGKKSGTAQATATTDSNGAYSFPALLAGSYTAEVKGNIGATPIITSYFTLVNTPGSDAANRNQDFPVTVPLSSSGTGQYRIVLTWGSNPSDLDSYLTGPTTAGTRFQTSYTFDDQPNGSTTTTSSGSMTYRVAGPSTEAFLDVDNTIHGTSTSSNNGPETTSILKPIPGVYHFFVRHYSGSSNISASGAQVKLYKGDALLRTFNPPATAVGDDDVWAVFKMTVTANGESVTPVNQIFIDVNDTSTAFLDGLLGGVGACPGGPFTNKVTFGACFNGTEMTGVGTSFGQGDIFARIESSTPFTAADANANRFARLIINDGAYAGGKDFCATCNTPPVLNCPNVMIGKFRITDEGGWNVKVFSSPRNILSSIGEFLIGSGNITTSSSSAPLCTANCPTSPLTNRITIGTGFDGTNISGTGSTFSRASLANGGDLYVRIESSSTMQPERFARLTINNGTYAGGKDFCATCNTQPLLNCGYVMIGKFRITDTGPFTIKVFSVPMGGFSETLIDDETITITP